ncbi:MAG: hypothetical protein HY814_11220 [Candidatus Riflebacteria bacterium]|nr:hypothetical protein [Candidatus Riflebacteria bacterium]
MIGRSIDAGLLMRVGDWHALSLEVARDLCAAGHPDVALQVEAGAAAAFLKLLNTADRRTGWLPAVRRTRATSRGPS